MERLFVDQETSDNVAVQPSSSNQKQLFNFPTLPSWGPGGSSAVLMKEGGDSPALMMIDEEGDT